MSNDLPPTSLPADPADPPVDPALQARVEAFAVRAASLAQSGRSGANWFYWIAALSLINSGIALVGGDVFFVVGLGVTLLCDALALLASQQAPEQTLIFKGVAFGIDVLIAGVVAGCGWLAAKRYLAVYAVGMALYLCDALIFVWLENWLSVGFHGFALVWMWAGFQAFRKLSAEESAFLNSFAEPA